MKEHNFKHKLTRRADISLGNPWMIKIIFLKMKKIIKVSCVMTITINCAQNLQALCTCTTKLCTLKFKEIKMLLFQEILSKSYTILDAFDFI